MTRIRTLSLPVLFLHFAVFTCLLFPGCSFLTSHSSPSLPYQRRLRNVRTPLIFEGRVVGVDDGDSITVADAGNQNHRIRLAGIDAPERAQAFGSQSEQYLSEAILNRVVTVEWSKHDRYGRIVGKVTLGGSDVCLRQIEAGLAWHYKDYQNEQTVNDRLLYSDAEEIARSDRVGLWIENNPIPPWDFRHSR